MIEKVPASSLIIDPELYPRVGGVNAANVRALIRKLEAGFELPPVAADRLTCVLSDGAHRVTASLGHFGPNAIIAVEWLNYRSRAELFADAIRRNAQHGLRLNGTDEARCVALADKLGLQREQLQLALHATAARMRELSERLVLTPSGLEIATRALKDNAKRQAKAREAGEVVRPVTARQAAYAHADKGKVGWKYLLESTTAQVRDGMIPADNKQALKLMRELGASTAEWLAGR